MVVLSHAACQRMQHTEGLGSLHTWNSSIRCGLSAAALLISATSPSAASPNRLRGNSKYGDSLSGLLGPGADEVHLRWGVPAQSGTCTALRSALGTHLLRVMANARP